MIEILIRVSGHAKLLHHTAGGRVVGNGEGNDLWKSEDGETVVKNGGGAFGGQALVPVFGSESPGNLHAGSEMRLESGYGEADGADELACIRQFHGPVAEAVIGEVGDVTGENGVSIRLRP